MDNVGNNLQRSNNPDEPIPFDVNADEPNRPEANPAGASPGVSRAPLNLGGGTGAPAPTPTQTPKPAAAPAAAQAPRPPVPRPPAVRPVPPRPVAVAGAGAPGLADRITTCKVFFTKLHPGAIKFIEEQITGWLKENPTIVIKHTNVIMGEVQEKKTEPNIVIVVWY
jgi:hypothetical protein